MISCSHCNHSNPTASKYCSHCGNWLGDSPSESKQPSKSLFSRMPSWLSAIIAILTVFAFIAFIVLLIASMSTFEGVASLIFLAIGIIGFIVFPLRRKVKSTAGKSMLGAVVVFYALMGAVIDQTGNLFYNKPVEWCNCDSGTSLDRKTDVGHPYGGKTIYTQDFTCYDQQGEMVKQISLVWVLLIRFVEYVVIALLLIGLQRLIFLMRDARKRG